MDAFAPVCVYVYPITIQSFFPQLRLSQADNEVLFMHNLKNILLLQFNLIILKGRHYKIYIYTYTQVIPEWKKK